MSPDETHAQNMLMQHDQWPGHLTWRGTMPACVLLADMLRERWVKLALERAADRLPAEKLVDRCNPSAAAGC